MTARIASKALVVFLALVALLAVLPLLGLEGYHLRLLSLVFLWISLAGCWNFMSGYTGYIDFGPVAYFGAGAYATAILMIRLDLPFPHSLALSGVICALLSAMIGWATLRIRGAYFAIATFAAAEALKQVSLEGDRVAGFEFFGGSHGLTLPPPPASEFFYYTLLGFLVLVVGISFFIEKTKFGYGLKAIRESELSAELSGVPTLALKVKAYILSSSLIGCLGGVEAYWLTYIIPDDVFNVMRTIQMVIMTLLGGMGTVWGPVIGAGFLTLVAEFLGAKFVYDYLTILGVVIIIVILVLPRGIMSLVKGKRGEAW
ncbi:MAG: inner-rane translocator [Deltaproteobacteria bacterium]|jgi:branched-chain amino acid transport system permease protein|nr:inner-rane translocator [Deltaproteobacteria bacterium]